VNPSLEARSRHPWRSRPRNRTHPAFDRFPRSVRAVLGGQIRFPKENGSDPILIVQYLTDVSTKVDTYQQPQETIWGRAP
ncbi:hypothetical protein, partial [Stenotrophomonas maltophilia]|uniref:hypothetical protein n=1 Tax=Stenotrophomonas maltophilia TaxID=40324 RepID=UPI001C60BB41